MKLPKTVLKKMSVDLRTKTTKQLEELLSLYSSQLAKLSDKDYEYYSTPLKQKLELIKQELYHREVLTTQKSV